MSTATLGPAPAPAADPTASPRRRPTLTAVLTWIVGGLFAATLLAVLASVVVTALTNVHTEVLELGSPTTHGRPDAGYTRLFWRGPRAWTGRSITAAGADDDQVMGSTGAWAAISGEHDEIDGGATVLAYLGTSSAPVPLTWFSRSVPFACLNPSPAFDAEIKLEPGRTLELRHRFVFIDRAADRAALEPIANEFAP